MDYTNSVGPPSSLKYRILQKEIVFKELDQKAADLIDQQEFQDVQKAIQHIHKCLQNFINIVNCINSASMKSTDLSILKDAYINFHIAKILLDYYINNNLSNVSIENIKALKTLLQIMEHKSYNNKKIKEYISDSVGFGSDIQSRFNSLLNGGSQIVEKSKLIDTTSSQISSNNLNTLNNNNNNNNNIIKNVNSNSSFPIPSLNIIQERPRSISPSPLNSNSNFGNINNHSNTENILNIISSNGYVTVEQLLELYHSCNDKTLVIDYRPESDFKLDHISFFSHIINIDPITIKPHYVLQDILDHSLLLNSLEDKMAFMNINKFDLILIIDQSSIHAKLSQSLVRLLAILDEKNTGEFKLKRKPAILDGGFNEWNYFMNNKTNPVLNSNNLMSNTSLMLPGSPNNNNGQNYTHTPIISRSPSPLRVQNFDNYNLTRNNRFQAIPDKLSNIMDGSPLSSSFNRTRSPSPLKNKGVSNFPIPMFKVASSKTSNLIPVPSSNLSNKLKLIPPQNSSSNTPTRSTSPNRLQTMMSGLYNLGNSCYMNAVLQCMISTKELTIFLLDNDYTQFVATDSKLGSRGILTNEYKNLAQLMLENTIKHSATNPKKFKYVVGKVNKSFDNYDQQDSAEFLHFLLDMIHEDLNVSANKTPLNISNEDEERRDNLPFRLASAIEWERYLRTDYSTIVEIFSGQYASRLTCNNCYKNSTTYIPFNMISVPIPSKPAVKITDCIEKFISPELLTKDNLWKCPKCKINKSSTKKLTLTRLPRVLILHLERFSYKDTGFIKNNAKVDIPERLSMKKYWPKPQDDQERNDLKFIPVRGQDETNDFEYHLFGIVRHYGTLDTGHYIANVKKLGQWYKFDDDKIGKLNSTNTEIDGSAYILFYERIG